jgi:hypothetical protein
VSAQTQEAQHQPLFASIAALCEECLRFCRNNDAAVKSGLHKIDFGSR